MSWPGPLRRAPVSGPYLEVEIPDLFRVDFLQENGKWMDWGVFRAEDAKRLPDGTYVIASGGAPFYIRCVADHGDFILHIDGGGKGEPFYYRLVPID